MFIIHPAILNKVMQLVTCVLEFLRGGSRIYKRGGGGGLTQGTNLLGRGVQSMLELGGSGGMSPQENFEK